MLDSWEKRMRPSTALSLKMALASLLLTSVASAEVAEHYSMSHLPHLLSTSLLSPSTWRAHHANSLPSVVHVL